MNFEKAFLVSDNLDLATESQVRNAEKKLKATLPDGYSTYVTKLGRGVFAGYVRIYMPASLVSENKEWRERIAEYFFWDEGKKVLSQKRVKESIIIGDTLDGDELIFHPSDPEAIYVLPRNEEMIYRVGQNLDEALNWLCTAGILTAPLKFRYFLTDKDRKTVEFNSEGDLDYKKAKKSLLDLRIHQHAEELPKELYLQLFVKNISGTVSVFGPPNNLVRVESDKAIKKTALQPITDVIRKFVTGKK